MAEPDELLVSTKILIAGSELKESYDIYEFKVIKPVNKIATAIVKLLDGSVAKEDFKLSDGDELIPGKEIEIQVGFGMKTKPVFKGVITAQSIRHTGHGGSMLIIECKDKAVKMTIGQNNNVFTDSTDSSLMQKLAGNHGLANDIASTSNTYPQIVQYYATDWDFLMARAEVNGLLVTTDNNKLTVAKPASSAALATFTFGDNIFEFNTKMDARYQLSGVNASAWDYKSQAIVDASASDPSLPEQGNITGKKLSEVVNDKPIQLQTTGNLENGELKSWADGKLLKSRLARIQGEIKVEGNASLEPNKIISLKGMGKRFNGDALISEVVHEVSQGNWYSYIKVGFDPDWFAKSRSISAQPASALLPGIRGLQNATVKKIYEDPKSETRIQVEVPIFKNAESTLLWARWVQPYATSGAGQFFVPEVGDEVVLGFLNEDPRFPVILGSLYSSQKAPPYTPAEENPIKAIVTKNQLKIEFDDKNKVLTITTPGENKVIFSDKDQNITLQDQNSNKVAMSSSGIEMNSPADIKITAQGNVNISGTAGVKISSDASVEVSGTAGTKISGLEVKISADTSFSASGGAEASVSGGGQLALKGAMVMIN